MVTKTKKSTKAKKVINTTESALAMQTENEGGRDVMIADAAYFRAQRRSFSPGYEVEDWLEAEKEIKQLVS